MLREPRREITESVVGIVVVGGLLSLAIWADYAFAVWFEAATVGSSRGPCPLPLGMIIGVILAAGAFGLLVLTHRAGDAICNALATARHSSPPAPASRQRLTEEPP